MTWEGVRDLKLSFCNKDNIIKDLRVMNNENTMNLTTGGIQKLSE